MHGAMGRGTMSSTHGACFFFFFLRSIRRAFCTAGASAEYDLKPVSPAAVTDLEARTSGNFYDLTDVPAICVAHRRQYALLQGQYL